MKATFIRETIGGTCIWLISGQCKHFYSYWTKGHSKQQIEDYYNN